MTPPRQEASSEGPPASASAAHAAAAGAQAVSSSLPDGEHEHGQATTLRETAAHVDTCRQGVAPKVAATFVSSQAEPPRPSTQEIPSQVSAATAAIPEALEHPAVGRQMLPGAEAAACGVEVAAQSGPESPASLARRRAAYQLGLQSACEALEPDTVGLRLAESPPSTGYGADNDCCKYHTVLRTNGMP